MKEPDGFQWIFQWMSSSSSRLLVISVLPEIPPEGEQLLEAMMAQGLPPSIYTLSVVVKCLVSTF